MTTKSMLNHHQPTNGTVAAAASANLSARAKHFSIDSLINKDPTAMAAVAAAMARFNGIPWPAASAGGVTTAVGHDNGSRKRSSTEMMQNRSKKSKLDIDENSTAADADEEEMINVDEIDGQSVEGNSSQEEDFGSSKSTDGRSPTPNTTFADSFASSFGKYF